MKYTAKQMHADGFRFYRAENGVWLTEAVPAAYTKVIEAAV